MAEETEEKQGFFGQLKTQIIGGAGVVLAGIGTMFLDEVKSFVGIEDDPTEQVAPAQSNNQSVNVSGPEIIINVPQSQPSVVREVVREVPVETKKDTVVAEPPKESAQSRLLKYKKN
jgi:hypothetical protein